MMRRTRGPPSDLAIVAIIPARFGSTRLPGKPLSDIHGKPMIQRVHERVRLARRVDRVLVATDDERIAAAVRGFGGEAVMTSPDARERHRSAGRGRARDADAEIVVNVQGDEPHAGPRRDRRGGAAPCSTTRACPWPPCPLPLLATRRRC